MTGRVIVIGDVVTDVVGVVEAAIVEGSDTPARITVTGGGGGANTAAWLAHAGAPVTLCAAVGTDAAGTARIDELLSAGVTCVAARHADAVTGSVIVLSRARSGVAERTMISDRGANDLLTSADVDAAFAAAPEAVHLHLSGYTLLHSGSNAAGRHALEIAHERGLTASVDAGSAAPLREVGGPAFISWVRRADVLLANGDEAAVLIGDAGSGTPPLGPNEMAAALATRLAGGTEAGGIVVVKLGAAGAVAATGRGAVLRVPASAASAADVTGAGDAFAAGFLIAWLGSGDVGAALAAGAELGAVAVTTIGGRPVGRGG
ncbi:MAG TPA: PfkB family carbohydrate kinase [Micromonosporaceae bacterium]|nr:PfkB family carbohydrate kinase [Micromonosporaceae bacterium]